jgi:predicted regulator of Ras-like GTPase activity (Roadblock/LC7/MglB family)
MFRFDPLLLRAVNALPRSTPEARQEVYRRARGALLDLLQNNEPRLTKDEIASQQREFDEAIARVEAQFGAPSPEPKPSARPQGKQGGDSWLTELLARASDDDHPADPQPVKPPQPRERQAAVLPFLRRRSDTRVESERGRSTQPDDRAAILAALRERSPSVKACALIAEDGSMIAGSLPPEMEDARVAGVAKTLQNLGSRAAIELSRGGAQEVIVRGEHGYAILARADRGGFLLALTDEGSQLGLILLDARRALDELEKTPASGVDGSREEPSQSLQGVV